MHLKKFLLFGLIAAILPAVAEEAADRKTATSLNYVEHELSTRQNKFTAEANKAMEYTNTAGTVQKRAVKSDLGTSTTDTSLPMVGGVNTKLNQKQDDIDPVNDHTAVTYTGQPGGIGQKGIYQATESYANQSDNLIDAKTFNAALKKGLDNEFKCRDYKPDTDLCWVYSIHNATEDNTILPPGYTPLEYIESDGHQYIDTEIVPSSDLKWELDNMFTGIGNIGQGGSYNGVYDPVQPIMRFDIGLGNGLFLDYGNVNRPTSDTQQIINHRMIFKVDAQNMQWAYGSTTGSIPAYTDTANRRTKHIYLFARNDFSGFDRGSLQRTFSSKFYRGGVLIQNLIPAKHGNTVGMYDTVSQRFFENLGTGNDFTAGPEATNNNLYIPQNQ